MNPYQPQARSAVLYRRLHTAAVFGGLHAQPSHGNAGQQLTRRARRPLLSCSPYTLDTAALMLLLMASVHQHASGWQARSACAPLAALCLQMHPLENAM